MANFAKASQYPCALENVWSLFVFFSGNPARSKWDQQMFKRALITQREGKREMIPWLLALLKQQDFVCILVKCVVTLVYPHV